MYSVHFGATGHVIIHIPPPTSKNLGGAEILSQDVEGWENDQDPDVNKFILLSLLILCHQNLLKGIFKVSEKGTIINVFIRKFISYNEKKLHS